MQSGGSPYGYTGEWWEADAGLLHLRARWYAPGTGTFLSRDAWPGDMLRPGTLHPYGYVGQNPINLSDPTGNCYPPIEFLRSVETVVCQNLDQAVIIYKHPNATFGQRAAASFYMSTWAVSHSAVIVGTSIAGYHGAGAIANWGYAHILAKPALAKAVSIGTVAASTVDDAAAVTAAATGDTQAAAEIMTLSSADGVFPFADAIAGTRYFGTGALRSIDTVAIPTGNTCSTFDEGANGIAVIKGYAPSPGDQYPHFTVEVHYRDEVIETEQVITRLDYSQSRIETVLSPRTPAQSITLPLPDAKAAQDFQRSVMNTELGPYGLNNSCVTHVCDVLRAGGAEGVPNPPKGGIRDITYIRKDLGFNNVFP